MAKGHPDRYKVISRWGAYHGATLGALAITGKPSMRGPYTQQFVDMPHIPPVYCYRCPFDLKYPECALRCADELEAEIERQGPDTVAGFIAEPIAGATLGAVVPPDGYWRRIREVCDRYEILLIADEVMTGMGRAGHWFAIDEWGIVPDVICLGKGVSGGYLPLSVAAMRGEHVDLVNEKLGDFNHGGTFSHQPPTAAAGVAAVRYLENQELVPYAAEIGKALGQKLRARFGDHPNIGDIRGMGLMWALELVKDKATKEPFPISLHFSSKVFEAGFADGLIVYVMSGCADGEAGDHLMVSPPLVVTDEQLDEIIEKLASAIDKVIADFKP
jgi:adenosylmethionine-8-amino-7-oxononanoate aminotransferase